MAQHKSAKKRARQTVKRNARNRAVRSELRGGVKEARTANDSGDAEGAAGALRRAEALLRRAASKGVIPKQRASRTISRLAKAKHQLSAG